MLHRRCTYPGLFSIFLVLALPATALAQVCFGLPAEDGHISVQLQATARDPEPSYGGRVGMNFNTPLSIDLAVDRPDFSAGTGTTVSTAVAYRIPVFEPAMCPLVGLQYSTRPSVAGDVTSTLMPIGLGVGRRLGSARSIRLGVFARPELLYVIQSDGLTGPEGDGLPDKFEGRGVLGLILATPLVYGIGSVEVASLNDYDPVFSVGVGVTF